MIRINERRLALFVAVVLVVMSAAGVVRQQGWLANSQRPATEESIPAGVDTPDKPIQVGTLPAVELDAPTTDKATTQQEESTAITGDAYTYTAAAGDSYTLFARDAIAQYAAAQKLSVTADQVLIAESDLAVAAGLPLLDIGQSVGIAKAAVAQALQAAGVVATTAVAATEQKQATAPTATNDTGKDYAVQAKAGDSYMAIARSAVTSYMQTSKLALTPAQRIVAETTLGVAAGLPEVQVGQQVTISKAALQQAATAAKELSTDQQATWAAYAADVIFE